MNNNNDNMNEIEFLRSELDRVRKIATHRLEVLAARQCALAEINDELAVELATRIPLRSSMVSVVGQLSEEPPVDHEMDHGYRGAIPTFGGV
jgi:hypothetical protein